LSGKLLFSASPQVGRIIHSKLRRARG
jgi:hypothetical protein